MTTTANRVALYARVSTNAQHIENQLRRLHEVATLRGWSVVGEYVETVSGAAKVRPVFDRLMADARRRRFDTIAAVDVSRLGRSLSGLVGGVAENGEAAPAPNLGAKINGRR